MSDPIATSIVLSFPETLSNRARDRVGQEYYRTYLRRTLGEVSEGEIRQEFTDVGCCGSQIHIDFRVERVRGGDRVGDDTGIEFVTRPAGADTSAPNPWTVQNEIDAA